MRHHLPLYHMQAMMDMLDLHASPQTDFTLDKQRLVTASFQNMCVETQNRALASGRPVWLANCDETVAAQRFEYDRATGKSGLGTYLYRPNNNLAPHTPLVSGVLSQFTTFSGTWKSN